jgi:hypothetical protein
MRLASWEYRTDGTVRLGLECPDRKTAAALESSLSGTCWVRGEGDGVVRHDRFPQPAPALEADPIIAPHFPGQQVQTAFVPYDDTADPNGPVYAQHLCGYEYTPERYSRAAAWMESAGFRCMRSPREPDGKYWEVWYLPGPYRARGPIEGLKDSREIAKQVAIHARPGAVTLGAQGGWFQTVD